MHDFGFCPDVLVLVFGIFVGAIVDLIFSICTYFLEKARTERFNREGPQPSLLQCLKNKFFSRIK